MYKSLRVIDLTRGESQKDRPLVKRFGSKRYDLTSNSKQVTDGHEELDVKSALLNHPNANKFKITLRK